MGYYLWDVIQSSQNEIAPLINNNRGLLLVSASVIDCFSCFEFHINHIKDISENAVPVIVYSPGLSEFIASYINNAQVVYVDNDEYDSPLLSYGLLISYVDYNGKILLTDVADPTNYDKSEHFYNRLERFLK